MNRRIVIVLACALQATRAAATILAPADLGDLSQDATAIVRGRVAAVESRWSADRRSINTLVTIDVESSLKGPLNVTTRFLLPGGTLGRYRSFVVGGPAFTVGQHVIVFLGWRPPDYPYLVGFSQGVFKVVADRDGLGLVVIPPPIVRSGTQAVPITRGDLARRPLPLAAFEQHVRDLVQGH